jgi:hypothetical protein
MSTISHPTGPQPSSEYWQTLVRSRPELIRLVTPRMPWPIPHQPTDKQRAFLLFGGLEAFFGGAGGGGKSDALLMAAFQWVDISGYSAIIFRRTFADLALPGALMDRSKDWLLGTGATWNEQRKVWTFPSGGPRSHSATWKTSVTSGGTNRPNFSTSLSTN